MGNFGKDRAVSDSGIRHILDSVVQMPSLDGTEGQSMLEHR
jgi:hypothetical protein